MVKVIDVHPHVRSCVLGIGYNVYSIDTYSYDN